MEARHKQRLVGATVVLALAVIFVPMLLSGPAERTRVDVPIDVPERPDVDAANAPPEPGFSETQPTSVTPSRSADASDAESDNSAEPTDRDADAAEAEDTESGNAPPPEASNGSQARSAPAPPEPTNEPGSQSAQTASSGGWFVQVGAFARRDNAVGLRKRLRASGFPAALDKTQRAGEPLYRVRVGPVEGRNKAATLAERLSREQDLQGMVVPPP